MNGILSIQLNFKIASCFYQLSDFQNSKIYFKRDIQQKIEYSPFDYRIIAESFNNLAETLRLLKNTSEAIKGFNKALEYYDKSKIPDLKP